MLRGPGDVWYRLHNLRLIWIVPRHLNGNHLHMFVRIWFSQSQCGDTQSQAVMSTRFLYMVHRENNQVMSRWVNVLVAPIRHRRTVWIGRKIALYQFIMFWRMNIWLVISVIYLMMNPRNNQRKIVLAGPTKK